MNNITKSLIKIMIIASFLMFSSLAFGKEITNISVSNITVPLEGERSTTKNIVVDAEGIKNIRFQWLTNGSQIVTGEYQRGKEYFLLVAFDLEDGYTMSSSLTINASPTPKRSNWSTYASGYALHIYYDCQTAYNVTFDPQNRDLNIVIKVPKNGIIPRMPEDPEYRGYIFAGWYLDTVNNIVFDPTLPIDNDKYVYAKWNQGYELYDVEFEQVTEFNPVFGEEMVLPEFRVTSFTPAEGLQYAYCTTYFYKDGIYYDEEYISENHPTYESGEYYLYVNGCATSECKFSLFDFPSSKIINGEIYAKGVVGDYYIGYKKSFTIIGECRVDFNVVNGPGIDPYEHVVPGSKISSPTKPTYEGYYLNCWYSDEELENKFDFTSTNITEDTTLYGRWEFVVKDIEISNFKIAQIGKKANQMPIPTVPEDAHYAITKFTWNHSEYPYDELTDDEVFEEGKKYFADIWIEPKKPYNRFDLINRKIDSVTINGSSELYWEDVSGFEQGYTSYVVSTIDLNPVSGVMKGDLDNSNTITIIDVRLLLQAFIDGAGSTGWSDSDLAQMDMDDNKRIDIIDVRLLLQDFIDR